MGSGGSCQSPPGVPRLDHHARAPHLPGDGRSDGQWHLYGPDGEIDIDGFGLFGHIRAADQTDAQQAAAAAVTD
ncbi:hypothetical protein ACFSKW_45490 [Nonomuraea mangrovi]|uniref:Uncharacterized protein n=1 Tax=Nonomuraea mangrovi TaxID=2316207 RepID=A0ABW4TCR6_9ACTN